MRRKEKEITEKDIIEDVIKKAFVCRLGLSEDNMPYIVPLCFGYKDKSIYCHSALEGKKIDIIKKNSNVCFEFEADVKLKQGDKPCNWGMEFQSVIGFGNASIIEKIEEKQEALNVIMEHYININSEKLDILDIKVENKQPLNKYDYNDNVFNRTAVIKIDISSMTGKRSG